MADTIKRQKKATSGKVITSPALSTPGIAAAQQVTNATSVTLGKRRDSESSKVTSPPSVVESSRQDPGKPTKKQKGI